MISRWLWNSYQRHMFLRAKAYRDIMKFRVSELAFLGVFKRYFLLWMLSCCFITIIATLGTTIEMSQAFHDIARFECFTDLNVFKQLCIQCYSKLEHGCFTILFDAAYFLLAVMVEGDESSRLPALILTALGGSKRDLRNTREERLLLL